MVRILILSLLIGMMVSNPVRQDKQTVVSNAKNVGVALVGDVPASDFDLRLRLTWTQTGSVIDTVGLNPAKVGSYALNVVPSEHLEFRVWDGSTWIIVDSGQRAPKGTETTVRVIRRGDDIHLETGGILGPSRRVSVALTRDPAYVGDFPGDQNMAPKYEPNLGFVGTVTIAYVGAPSTLPTSLVHDPQGRFNANETARLKAALDGLSANGIPLAIALLTSDDTAAKGDAVWIDGDLQSSRLLPRESGLLAFGQSSGWVYRRASSLNAKLPLARIQDDWKKLASLPTQAERIATLLEGLLAMTKGSTTHATTSTTETARVLVTADIGPDGGEIVAPNGPRVSVPAGAVLGQQKLTISEVGTTGARFRIEAEDPSIVFRRPVLVSLPVPAKLAGKKVAVAHVLSADMAVVTPISMQDSAHATVYTNTLSDWMVFEEGRLTAAGVPAGAAFIGTGILIVFKFSALTLAPSVGAMVAVGYAGWLAGDALHSFSMMRNLSGPIPGDGFEVYWHAGTTPPYPAIMAYYEKATGKLVLLTGVERSSTKPDAVLSAPKGGTPGLRVMVNGVERIFEPEQLESRLIPKAVLLVLGDLQYARWFYKGMGFEPPKNTWVAIHPFLSATKGSGQEKNAGEWDGKVLSVSTTDLGSELPLSDNIRGTLAHEYWHALSNAGFFESYYGKDESIATNMESTVLASPDKDSPGGTDFVRLRNWLDAGPVLHNGLNTVGPNEDRSKRGYQLWPWPKFILVTKGIAPYCQFVQNKIPLAQLETWWQEFARATTLEDRKLDNPATFQFGNDTLYTLTNFKGGALFESQPNAALTYGTSEKSRFEPFSLSWDGVPIPARPAGVSACPIIVRRSLSHQPDRYVGQTFMVGPAYDPKRKPAALTTANTRESTSRIAIPASEDVNGEEKRLPIVIFPTKKAMDLSEDSLLIYRLTPPTKFTTSFRNQNTLDIEIPAPRGPGSLLPLVHFQGYRLFIRGNDGKERQVADLLYRYDGQPTPGRVRIDPQTHRASVNLPLTEASIRAIGVATIDQGSPANEAPLISSIFWKGGDSGALGKLQACNTVGFSMFLPAVTWGIAAQKYRTTDAKVFEGSNSPKVPLVWHGTTFSAEGEYKVEWDSQTQGMCRVKLEGEVSADATRLISLNFKQDTNFGKNDGFGRPYFRSDAWILTDIPLEEGLKEGQVVGHASGGVWKLNLPSTGNNIEELFEIDWTKTKDAYIRVGFAKR